MKIWDKITINGRTFHEPPASCGCCPAIIIGRNDAKGFCTFFDKRKNRCDNVPQRCSELFAKGFALGGDLVIVSKNDD